MIQNVEAWKNLNAPIGGKAADYDFIFVITKSDVLVIPILCSLSHIQAYMHAHAINLILAERRDS